MDVAHIMGVPRLTAHRDLIWLHDAGLVTRSRSDEDRTHAWWYQITPNGVGVVEATMYASGRRPPPRLGRRVRGAGHFLMFLPLAELAAGRPGECDLFQWRTTMETSMWLRQYRLEHLRADASGVWLEGRRALRFLLHVDRGPGALAAADEVHSRGVEALVAVYRRGAMTVPVSVVLVVLTTAEREEVLRAALVRDPAPVPIATTNGALLKRAWPTDSVWQVSDEPADRLRLIDLAAHGTRSPK